ncbi:MAG: glycosyltransferase [Planctomycetota bacterium]|nr:glycosyltransferase [Planctomycetota bacterium]
MLSIIVPCRNVRELTVECLTSIHGAVTALGLTPRVEYILLDDQSDAGEQIPELFRQFRAGAGAEVRAWTFKQRQHYTGSFAFGLSRARGDLVLFISNDMHVTAPWMRTLLAVAAVDRRHGIVRGVANICDSHEYHQVQPPVERGPDDYHAFAEYLAKAHGLTHVEDTIFSGDAVLIRRELIEKIGVLDTRFYGYFGDPDYGLRARRAGFKLVCAKGAWLKHYGQGHVKGEHLATGVQMDELKRARMELVVAAFEKFRAKWGSPPVPAEPADLNLWDWPALLKAPAPKGGEFQNPLPDDGSIARPIT